MDAPPRRLLSFSCTGLRKNPSTPVACLGARYTTTLVYGAGAVAPTPTPRTYTVILTNDEANLSNTIPSTRDAYVALPARYPRSARASGFVMPASLFEEAVMALAAVKPGYERVLGEVGEIKGYRIDIVKSSYDDYDLAVRISVITESWRRMVYRGVYSPTAAAIAAFVLAGAEAAERVWRDGRLSIDVSLEELAEAAERLEEHRGSIVGLAREAADAIGLRGRSRGGFVSTAKTISIETITGIFSALSRGEAAVRLKPVTLMAVEAERETCGTCKREVVIEKPEAFRRIASLPVVAAASKVANVSVGEEYGGSIIVWVDVARFPPALPPSHSTRYVIPVTLVVNRGDEETIAELLDATRAEELVGKVIADYYRVVDVVVV